MSLQHFWGQYLSICIFTFLIWKNVWNFENWICELFSKNFFFIFFCLILLKLVLNEEWQPVVPQTHAKYSGILISWKIWPKEEKTKNSKKFFIHSLCFKWPYIFQNWTFCKTTFCTVLWTSIPFQNGLWIIFSSYMEDARPLGVRRFKGHFKTTSIKITNLLKTKKFSNLLNVEF